MPRNSPRPGTPPGIRSNCALAPLPAPIAPVPIDGRRKPRYHILITLGQRDKPPRGNVILPIAFILEMWCREKYFRPAFAGTFTFAALAPRLGRRPLFHRDAVELGRHDEIILV